MANTTVCYCTSDHRTEPRSLVYVPSPVTSATKLVMCLVAVVIGVVGFVGNSLALRFLSKMNHFQSRRFVRNMNVFLKSLALSYALCDVISIPLMCVQFYLDELQSGWACKLTQYFISVFPVVTINNLVVMSAEKYFSTRRSPRSFSLPTVQKLVWCAWLAGFLVMVVPGATRRGMKYNLTTDHYYTISCNTDPNYHPIMVNVIFVLIQFIIPFTFLCFVNISLIRAVLARRRVCGVRYANNPIRATFNSIRIRGITLLITITTAFIIPYLMFISYSAYNALFKPNISFQTYFIIRHGSVILITSNSAINVVVHLAQMKTFRQFLKNSLLDAKTIVEYFPSPGCRKGSQYASPITIEMTSKQMASTEGQASWPSEPAIKGAQNDEYVDGINDMDSRL